MSDDSDIVCFNDIKRLEISFAFVKNRYFYYGKWFYDGLFWFLDPEIFCGMIGYILKLSGCCQDFLRLTHLQTIKFFHDLCN
jgi:hypothetical protein